MASLPSTSNQELTDTSYTTRLSSELNDLRLEGRFCDITIVAGDDKLQAHKLVLSGATSYFRNMFSSTWQENESSKVEVPGSGESFKPILDFAYTGTFKVSVHTGIGVLGLACYMGFTEVMAACGGYLIGAVDYFSLDDCLKIWSHASCHVPLTDLAQCYRKHLMNRFAECMQSQLCLECSPVDFLLEGLCDEEIEDSCTEEQILQLTIRWLRYKWEHRKTDTINVLRKMRLGLIPGDRLKEIIGDEILAIPECKALVDEVVKLQATTEQAEMPLMISKPDLFATRNTITAAVLAEDKQGHALYMGCIDNTGCYKLTQMADIPVESSVFENEHEEGFGFTLIVTDTGHLYAAGGNTNGLSFLDDDEEERYQQWVSANNFFRYDWDRNEWTVLPPMLTVAFLPTLLQVKDYLYCIIDPEHMEPAMIFGIQRYSLSHQTWEDLSDHTMVSVTSAVVFDGCILFQSGIYNEGFENTNRFVIFKPEENRWCEVACHENVRFSDGRSYGGSLVVHKSICYFKKVFTGERDKVEVIRLVCNLKNDEPSITFAEMVDRKEAFGTDVCGADPTLFTFDKRKLGMTRVPCECTAHKK